MRRCEEPWSCVTPSSSTNASRPLPTSYQRRPGRSLTFCTTLRIGAAVMRSASWRRPASTSSEGTPWRHLAVRVIDQAFRDLASPPGSHTDQESARAFLAGSSMLYQWCEVANLDPSWMVSRARTLMARRAQEEERRLEPVKIRCLQEEAPTGGEVITRTRHPLLPDEGAAFVQRSVPNERHGTRPQLV